MKIGILGVGHLGRIHCKLIKEIRDFELVGFYDPNEENAQRAIKEFGIKRFANEDELFAEISCVDIVTPTLYHFEAAQKAVKNGIHVFIEKPVTHTVEEAKTLLELSHEGKVKIQVGHVERFNPAFEKALPYLSNPMFIETHRLAQFNPRGTDVSVVLDLMIHDIDIVLSIVNSPVKSVVASGVAVVSSTPDICNARIEFNNGCVANLTASRISMKNMRKSRFFQRDAYISVDFLDKELSLVKLKEMDDEPGPFDLIIDLGEGKKSKQIYFENPEVEPNNAIKRELETFYESIVNDTIPKVSIIDGFNALEVAHKIIKKLKLSGL
jgi:predicted dehydrogenase